MAVTQTPQSGTPAEATPPPTPQPRAVVCPFCGHISGETARCARCSGRFDPLSRQATQNAMGPWSFIDPAVPTRAGCSYETLRSLVERGVVRRDSVVRGPSTRQFWMLAPRVPGVAHLLGVCHSCQGDASPGDYACGSCGAVFEVDRDRQHLGVGPIRLIAGQAPAGQVVASLGIEPETEAPVAGREFQDPAAPFASSASIPEQAGPVDRESAARARLARHRAARARKRVIAIVITAAAVVAGGAGMFAMGMLAGNSDVEPAPSETAAP